MTRSQPFEHLPGAQGTRLREAKESVADSRNLRWVAVLRRAVRRKGSR